MDEYINSFKEESREMLINLEDDLLNLEKGENKELINNIFRTMHTLKGASRMYGFENMESLTHEFEHLYNQIRNGKVSLSKAIIDVTLSGKDTLLSMLDNSEFNVQETDLIESINRIMESDQTKQISTGSGNNGMEINKYLVFFSPDRGIFNRGLDPDKVLDEIKELGNRKIVIHTLEGSWDEDKKNKICNTAWEIYLVSTHEIEEVKDVLLFYDEDEYDIIDINSSTDYSAIGNLDFYKTHMKSETDIENYIIKNFEELSLNPINVESESKLNEESEGRVDTDNSNTKSNGLSSTINVASKKIDELMNLVSNLVSSTAELKSMTEVYKDYKLNNAIENIDKITKQFRSNALELRLVPVGMLLNKFNRHVRDLSQELDKDVNLIIEGQETEIDKSILKAIEKPLLHIIRNSLDHGIETKEERVKKGKPENGVIKITAFYTGVNVVIQIQDDGKGIDLDKIKQIALDKGFIEKGQQVSEGELLAFIMEPGFTTSDALSKVSGRGFGMDIVKKELSTISGSIEIETEKDLGTFITLKLPSTLSIIDTLKISVGSSTFLVPLLEIDYCFQESWENIYTGENDYLKYNDSMLPFISLTKKFKTEGEERENEMVIVINKYDKKYGIVVNNILGEHQAVIKPLGELFVNQPYFSGGSIMVDGELALILDTNYLFNQLALN